MHKPFIGILYFGLISIIAGAADLSGTGEANTRVFAVKGIVREVNSNEQTVIVSNEAISNYMEAMTMPFHVKDSGELKDLYSGDIISFRLHVTGVDSWVDRITPIGTAPANESKPAPARAAPAESPPVQGKNPLWYYKFTNELGQAVSLSDFHGQALAITFFYTRCPLPNYCPRLSKNFEEASQKLDSMAGAPTNWHFLSISFDPQFDTPSMLKAYGESYQYDPKHWSFLTGPPDKIAELARQSGVSYVSDNGLINHNFRTLIVNPDGHLRTVFPMSGDFSDSIVAEMLKAAAVTNQSIVSR